jgi:hypothetical protein
MGENKKKSADNQQRKSRNYKLNLRISDEELETLNSISFEDDESISQVVRKAIKQYDTLRKNRKHF